MGFTFGVLVGLTLAMLIAFGLAILLLPDDGDTDDHRTD